MRSIASYRRLLAATWVMFFLAGAVPNAVAAAICDWRPSQLIGGGPTGAAVTAGGAVAATGTGLQIAGFYTLVHSTSGAVMLGSTAAVAAPAIERDAAAVASAENLEGENGILIAVLAAAAIIAGIILIEEGEDDLDLPTSP